MNRSGIISITTLSDSNFYQKIIQKYRKGKITALRLPSMIFYKKRGHFLPEKLGMKILLHIHISNKNILPPLNVKTIPVIREMISRSSTKKILQSILRPLGTNNILNVNNEKNIFLKVLKIPEFYQFIPGLLPTRYIYSNGISKVSFLKSLFFKTETMINESNETKNITFLAGKNALYMQRIYSISSNFSKLKSQMSICGIYLQIMNLQRPRIKNNIESINTAIHQTTNTAMYPTIVINESIKRYQHLYERKSTAIQSHNNFLLSHMILNANRLDFDNFNLTTPNKTSVKKYGHTEKSEFSLHQKKFTYGSNGERFRLHDQKSMEKEIENIKKIVIETKKSILEKSAPSIGEEDIKRYIDINRISSQVYHEIERTIRMERERRGI